MTCRPEMLRRAMPRSVVLLHLGSVLMSIACVTTGIHGNHMLNHVLNHVSKYEGQGELALSLTGPGRAVPPYRIANFTPH